MWRRLTRLADGVIHAYGKLRQKKVEHARMKSASESLEQFELRQHQRQNRIVALERRCKKLEDPLRRILHDMDCTGLCLSGGGIRSASFSLGVLQGLSRFSMKSQGNSLMEKLDYLSTVSGGGYIGSWLMAWARRVGYRKVIEQLSTPAVTSGDPEHRPVRHLREYTSYLAPKYGFSLDTLTLAAIVLRNMFLNWLMLVPAVVAMLCLPHMVLYLSYGVPSLGRQNVPLYFWLTMGLACLGIAIAAGVAVKHMAFPREAAGGAASDSTETAEPYGVKWFVGSLFISAWVLGELWLLTQVLTQVLNKDSEEPSWYLLLLWVLSSIPPFVVSWYRARNAVSGSNTLFNRPGALPTDPWWRRLRFWRLAGSFIGAFIAGSAAMLLLWGAGALFAHVLARANVTPDTIHNVSVLTIIPTVLLVLMVASAILSGLLSNLEREEEREWWSRAGGLLMALVLGWLGICAIAYFGREVLRGGMAAGLAALGLSTGFLGSLGGLSAATASGLKHVNKEQLTKVQRFLANHNLIVPAVCAIAALSLAVLFGAFTSWLSGMAIRVATNHPELFRYSNVADFVKYHPAVLVFAGAAVLLLANRFINVNAFSLHGMYRMRLTRAYLGASNLFRRPNPFTNFDPTDNLYEADLPKDGSAPLYVINAALNLVATRNLAWQQRKAEPFTFTPLHCGCWRIGYAPTAQYGGYRGVRLGAAMAISGAAVNPNMGYNSSALVTLLMTFFNARLGWWLPNPGWPALSASGEASTRSFLQQAGPTWGLAPLINEALGNTNDTSRFIQLSDGGHFENLGLYEMVMRRCHTIIVVDADADSKFEFEDLGNALRKIYIDLGIPIAFPKYPAGPPVHKGKDNETDASNLYCFSGEIYYSCVDKGAPNGKLVIIKPGLNGSEPGDVCAYAATHGTFPHESTVNQFFTEAQFESYRHLGSFVIDTIIDKHDSSETTMQAFVDLAGKYSPKPAAPAAPRKNRNPRSSRFSRLR
jgi:hypothetical protein